MSFSDSKVVVMGLGVHGGGVALCRFFCSRGARVLLTDLRSEEALRSSLDELDDLRTGIELVLGGHRMEDFTRADAVAASPAVPWTNRYLDAARSHGVPVLREMNLFFEACPARTIVGITGSNGKSTTTRMAGRMLASDGGRVWVGGNIGRPLLDEVDAISPDDRVVVELSSFQLEDLGRDRGSPRFSLVTNVTPNHLDRHADMTEYAEAKRQILAHQAADDLVVLNADDPLVSAWAKDAPGRVWWFGNQPAEAPGVYRDGDRISWRRPDGERVVLGSISEIPLPGPHNVSNAMGAAALALAAGLPPDGLLKSLKGLEGLPHRLEDCGRKRGIRFVNDSASTTPESTMAGIRAFAPGITLIAGGSDKGTDFAEMAEVISRRVATLILIGTTADQIEADVRASQAGDLPTIHRPDTLPEAFELACNETPTGQVVLLSPACASFDMFRNAEDRGEQFRDLVAGLQ